jgi:outer membrane protein assembly factor BamB
VCLDKKTGKKIWAHDLHEEYDAATMRYGSSPFEYKDNIIIHVGGEGHSIIAFDKKDGSVVWKNKGLTPGYATPQLIDFEGEEQLLILDGERVAGLNPSTGDLLWKHEFPADSNISTPVWGEDNTIFISSAYGKGAARAIKLTREDGKTKAEEIWKTKKLRIHHGNAIRLGDVILGSTGDFGPTFLVALDATTGKVLWRKRGFSKATFVYGDGKLIVLDEDGNLALTTPGREKIKIHSKVEMCKRIAWTAPTLVGTKLYLRDRKQIMALDLSAAANEL